MTTPPGCGLVSYGRNGAPNYLPLASVSADVHIVDVSARVILTQLYISDHNSDSSSRAQYIFPVPTNGAVCAFKMRASSGQAVAGIVMERSKAKKEYEIAISNDKWAGLLYETTPDVFVITIGAIQPRQNIEVTIMYVIELPDGDLHNRVEFFLPTYIAQRYGPAPMELTAPSSSTGNTNFNLTAEIQMTSQILSVTSPSHRIKVKTRNDKDPNNSKYRSTVILAPEARPGRLDTDFVLAIQALGLGEPRCVAEQRVSERTVALSLTLVPQFRLEHLPKQEYIFLIDRSGSMEGSRIEQAKQALIVFLQSLPADGTFFKIFSFGSSCSSLWPSSQKYTPSALAIARQHVDAMNADMGGTEIKTGLDNALDSQMRSIPTSLFLLTDGEVWRYDEIFSLVDSRVIKAGNTASGTYLRIFTLGIGDAASTALCEGVARRGNGLCLMTSHSSDISQKVSKLFLASRVSPLGNVENLEIDWGRRPAQSDSASTGANDRGKITHHVSQSPNPLGSANTQFRITLADPPKIQQAPTRVPNLYPNNRFTVFVILSDTTEVPKTVTLRGTFPDGSQINIPLTVAHEAPDGDLPPLIHTLAAQRLILELEDGDPSSQGSFDATDKKLHNAVIEAAIVRFSETYQLASQFASFIAVYKEQDGHDSDSDTDSDDFLDGQDDKDLDVSQIPGEGAWAKRRQSVEFGSTAGQRDPQDDLDQEGSDSDNNSLQARYGDGADPLAASDDDDDDDFSSISSMSSQSSARSQGDPLPFRIFKYLLSTWRKASRPKPPMRKDVDMPGAWLEAEIVIVTPARPKSREKPTATVISKSKGHVVTAARLQQFDGSFILDERLCSFVSDKLSLLEVKSAIPPGIRGVQDADKIWATVLVTAYMKAHLDDDKDIWLGLWKKAESFITSALEDKISFASLVDEALKLLG